MINLELDPHAYKLTGRIQESPSLFLNDCVLRPQFLYDLKHLLTYYIRIEKAMAVEYERLGSMSALEVQEIIHILDDVDDQTLCADPDSNMSDILFALERYVESRMLQPSVLWHMDRSRNDVQATAQLMFAKDQLLRVVEDLLDFSDALQTLAERTAELPMPGYTHYQPAQIITAGFYLTSMSEQLGRTIQRLQALFDDIDECPLGSGAMAGLELSWDRYYLARQLGFARPVRHALFGVASKEWMLLIAAELSTLSVALSRFATDFIWWSSSGYQLIDLPDQLSGISSAMPQKKNFPILERIRGKTAHISAYYVDFVMAQRNTPFTNLVETAKEGGRHFFDLMDTTCTTTALFTLVIRHLRFEEGRMHSSCSGEFFGGFSLANLLALQKGIPYRKSQVLAGKYIVGMIDKGLAPYEASAQLLQDICREAGYEVVIEEKQLLQAFSVEHNLHNKSTLGSTRPVEVLSLLDRQKEEHRLQAERWREHKRQTQPSSNT